MFDDEKVVNDNPGFAGGDGPETSLDRAQEYVKENPIFGDAPTRPADDKAPTDGAKPADGKQPEAGKPDAAKPDAAKPDEAGKSEEKKPETQVLEEKAVLEHPKYKELQTQLEGNKAVLDELRPILTQGAYPIQNAEQLKGVLNDSFMLYDIAQGKQKPGALLDAMEKNATWSEAQKQAVYLELRDYLHAKGVDMKAPELDPRNPEHRAILDLRAKTETREKADAQKEIETVRQGAVQKLTETVQSLAEKAGVEKDDFNDYALVIAAKIGALPEVLKQLEQGKTGEIERLFTEHHNREIARQKRWLDAKVKSKTEREDKLPRVGSSDAGPAPKGGDKPYANRKELQTSEGRIEAAKKEWAKGKTA